MPIETQAAFARRRGVSKQRVAQYLRDGTIDGAALVRQSGRTYVDSDVAEVQLDRRLDPGRRLDQKIAVNPGQHRKPKADPSALPPDLASIAAVVDNVEDWKAVALGMLLFRSIGATAALMALHAGAPLKVASYLHDLMGVAFADNVEASLQKLGVPTAAGLNYDPELRDDVDWKAMAADLGEPYDPDAWAAYRAERQALE